MPTRIEIIGLTFGKLKVVSEAPPFFRKNGKPIRQSRCLCECGKETIVQNQHLTNGHSTSCGCSRADSIATHGHARRSGKSKIYHIWKNFRRRALANEIIMTEPWTNSFESFLDGVGEPPSGTWTLDLIDTNKEYGPGNVRWATRQERNESLKKFRVDGVIGMRFGKLTVIGESEPAIGYNGYPVTRVLCRCDCGNERPMRLVHLKIGASESCGCEKGMLVHGHSRRGKLTPTYRSWQSMIGRCHLPNHSKYEQYAGKGITVCQQWRDSFDTFLKDMGECPKGCTIDRIDNAKGYEPSNCRWANKFQQAENKTGIKKYTVRGVTGCLAALCRHFGVNYTIVRNRIKEFGWELERALFTPSHNKR